MAKAKRKDFTINEPEGDIDQILAFGTNSDKYIKVREDMSLSRSSISKSMRKFRFQEEGEKNA